MSDLRTALARTTPIVAPIDVAGLQRAGRRRRARRRSIGAVAFGSILTVGTIGVVMNATQPPVVNVGTVPDSAALGTWTKTSPSPLSARSGAVGERLTDGRILVWGGYSGHNGLSDGAVFNPADGVWTLVPAGPVPYRADGGGLTVTAMHGDRLAVLASWSASTVAILDAPSGEWTEAPPLPALGDPFLAGTMAFDGSAVTLLGRLDATPPDPDDPTGHPGLPVRIAALRWSMGTDSWVEGAAAPLDPRFTPGVGASADGTRLALWGGQRRDSYSELSGQPDDPKLYNDGAVYDVMDDTWTPMPDLGLQPATQPRVLWVGDRIVVAGGLRIDGPRAENGEGSAGTMVGVGPMAGQPAIAMLEPSSGAVTKIPLPSERDQHAAESGQLSFSGDGTLIGIGRGDGLDDPQSTWFLGAVTGDEWRSAPESDVRSDAGHLVATSASTANPGDRSFVAQMAEPGTDWRPAAAAPFVNRMEPTVVIAGRYLLVSGGLEGSGIQPTTDSWLLTLGG